VRRIGGMEVALCAAQLAELPGSVIKESKMGQKEASVV
jgi:hypothetical protein